MPAARPALPICPPTTPPRPTSRSTSTSSMRRPESRIANSRAGDGMSGEQGAMANASGAAEKAGANRAWPGFRSLKAYRFAVISHDLFAGLTLAAIAIPEQMATAKLGGFAPQIGFFAFLAGSVGFAMLGGNRFLSCGADSTITPIFAGGLAALAATGSPDYQGLAIALALLVGVMLTLSGIFRLGGIANLLSVP